MGPRRPLKLFLAMSDNYFFLFLFFIFFSNPIPTKIDEIWAVTLDWRPNLIFSRGDELTWKFSHIQIWGRECWGATSKHCWYVDSVGVLDLFHEIGLFISISTCIPTIVLKKTDHFFFHFIKGESNYCKKKKASARDFCWKQFYYWYLF